METKVRAINRVTGVAGDLEANQAGELLVAQGAADYEEITRGGYAFHVKTTTATIGVVTLPTTGAGIGFWNSAPDGGRSMIVDAIFAIAEDYAATLGQCGLIYCLGQTREITLTDALVPRKNNGLGPTTDSIAVCAAGGAIMGAIVGLAINWMPIGPTVNTSLVSLPGQVLWAPVNGRLIIPPGRQFGINVWVDTAAATVFHCGMMWHEKTIKLN